MRARVNAANVIRSFDLELRALSGMLEWELAQPMRAFDDAVDALLNHFEADGTWVIAELARGWARYRAGETTREEALRQAARQIDYLPCTIFIETLLAAADDVGAIQHLDRN
jgi:ketosteroid isomerase-like protein